MCQAIKEMIEDGRREGRQEGQSRLMLLITKMTQAGEVELLPRLGEDMDFCREMYVKYGV